MRTLTAVLLFWAGSFAAGCGGVADGLRSLDLEVDGTWIGNAVCYGPHRDGQRPGGTQPTREQLAEDLELMSRHWGLLRIYGASEFSETLLELIRDQGLPMKVVLGVWIGPDSPEGNAREIEAGVRLANAYPEAVIAVSVGNETQVYWSAHRSSVDTLLAAVREVRSRVRVPVTVADDFNFWNKEESLVVAAEIDFIMVHAHPMWNGQQLEDAMPWIEEALAGVRAVHPGQALVLGETGWATSVADHGEQAELITGEPGESEQAVFYRQVRAWAGANRQPVFFFEAFDERWKGGPDPEEVEKHWGVFRADRTPKAAVAGA